MLSHSPSTKCETKAKHKKLKENAPWPRINFGSLPEANPCAQCGKPIAAPEWIENGPRRISYLWHCRACDYRFEAVAFFDEQEPDSETLAA